MTPKELFSCQDINWVGLKTLFQQMAGGVPPQEADKCVTLVELPKVATHVAGCEQCRETLVELARGCGINQGTIFSADQNKNDTPL